MQVSLGNEKSFDKQAKAWSIYPYHVFNQDY